MKFVPETGFNILIVGRWNPSIFSPPWIRKNIVDDQTEVALAMAISDPAAPPRLSFSTTLLFPNRQLLDFRATELTLEAFQATGEVASKIVGLLPHTPISAIGINFRFLEEINAEKVASVFQFNDAAKIPHNKYPLDVSTITRSFLMPDGDNLNLSLTLQGERAQADFNFHTETMDVPTIQKKISKENLALRFEEARNFMQTTYDLTLEE